MTGVSSDVEGAQLAYILYRVGHLEYKLLDKDTAEYYFEAKKHHLEGLPFWRKVHKPDMSVCYLCKTLEDLGELEWLADDKDDSLAYFCEALVVYSQMDRDWISGRYIDKLTNEKYIKFFLDDMGFNAEEDCPKLQNSNHTTQYHRHIR